ncbi:sulfotransferase family protein [soil metagenome]
MPPTEAIAPIDRFRALVASDATLQDHLAPLYVPEQFSTAAIAAGAVHGITLDAEMLHEALKPDPLGLARWGGGDATIDGYPTRQWLPTAIVPTSQGAAVSWVHFAGERLSDSFFETSARRAGALPINRLMRERSTLQSLIDDPVPDDALMPDGFIFHMSRCGSTLAAQMFAALPGAIVPSEAAPIDGAVQLNHKVPGLSLDIHARVLRAVVAALGRNRTGHDRRFVIKLDAWHMMALPLFRATFPDTPWAFMYRDPVEVMVSQKRQAGVMAVPGEVPPATFGIDQQGEDSILAYGAKVLGRICQAAIEGMAGGGGMLINYREMPDAVPERMLDHFGIATDDADRAAMYAATKFDVKSQGQSFTPDSARKHAEATPEVLAVVERYLATPYAALEALPMPATQ